MKNFFKYIKVCIILIYIKITNKIDQWKEKRCGNKN